MLATLRNDRLSRRRVELDEKSPDIKVRFALKLRGLVAKKGWTSVDLAERIAGYDGAVTNRAIDAWLRGDTLPSISILESLAEVLGITDYRQILPAPLSRASKAKAKNATN
jgi:transcriptional regulator with XRE-family HTH domain